MIWQNEFYWLDGTVTQTCHEGAAKYNVALIELTLQQVYDDINKPNGIRLGVSYDR